MSSVAEFRQFYARYVTASAGVEEARIVEAFQTVAREDFLPPGPWRVHVPGGYIETPSDDPAHLYQDIVIALDAARGINNGQPSLPARCLNAAAPALAERVLHVGCGAGYYTALLARLVGAGGRVEALEISPDLAARTEANLATYPNVAVSRRSGSEAPLPESDVIYVNAGASEPLEAWREALAPGGRLIFLLTPGWEYGAMLLVSRTGKGVDFAARFISRAAFIPCLGAQRDDLAQGLAAAFEAGDWRAVRSLRAGGGAPDESCWFAGEGWWLSTEPPAA